MLMYENDNNSTMALSCYNCNSSTPLTYYNAAVGMTVTTTDSSVYNPQDWTTTVSAYMGTRWTPGKPLSGFTCPTGAYLYTDNSYGPPGIWSAIAQFAARPVLYVFTGFGSAAYTALPDQWQYDFVKTAWLKNSDQFIMAADGWSQEDTSLTPFYFGYQREVSFRHNTRKRDSCTSGNAPPFPRGLANALFADKHVESINYVQFWNTTLTQGNVDGIVAHPHPSWRATTNWRVHNPPLVWQ
jgi:hypothetical protein